MSGSEALSQGDDLHVKLAWEAEWIPATTLPFLPDHFPGKPIIPAFYQLAYLRSSVASKLSVEPSKVAFKAIKFLRPIVPGAGVRARFDSKTPHIQKSGRFAFTFSLSVDGSIVTQGELSLV